MSWEQTAHEKHREPIEVAFSKVILEIEALASSAELPPKDFATTLSLIVLGEAFWLAAQVGDGRVVGLTDSEECVEIIAPYRSEFANETIFLTSDDPLRYLTVAVGYDQMKAVALHTDGLLSVSTHRQKLHIPFYESLFAYVEENGERNSNDELQAFLQSERIRSRCDDDLTLVLAKRLTNS